MNMNEANGTTEQQQALVAIEQLVRFALERRLLEPLDEDYGRNLLLELFGFSEPYLGDDKPEPIQGPQPALDVLIGYGVRIGLIPEDTDTYRDLLDAKMMGCLMPRLPK
ncbi:Galactose-1-phosphate uridylyltransferase [Paenibacillus sp. P1XP2]|nr:Galactose-1-phosphate uridylyltransferase [Paenibacillus sp. P1XP2]